MLLAYCDESEISGFLKSHTFTKFTKNTVCDPDEFKEALLKVSQMATP